MVENSHWLYWPSGRILLPHCSRQFLKVAWSTQMQKPNYRSYDKISTWTVSLDLDTLMSDGNQFTSGEFRGFCETYQIEQIAILLYHPRSNGQSERFVVTLKRALKKARATPSERALQQFLQVCRITPNNKISASQSPAKVMFTWSIYNTLLPKQMKLGTTCIISPKQHNLRGKVFFRIFKGKSFWEMGIQKKSQEYDIYYKGSTIYS